MENLTILTKDTITSLELLEQINFFREQEGRKTKLQHKTLLTIIRNEFGEEIHEQKILLMSQNVEIGNGAIKKSPYYILTLNQAKQVLMRESVAVRRAVINYIEHLEKELEYRRKTFFTLNKNLDFYITDEEIEEHIKTEEKSGVVFVKRKKIPNSYNLEFLTVTEFLFRKGEDLNNFSISDIGEKALESCKKIGLFVGKAWEGNRLVNTYPIHTLNHVYYSILDRRQIFRQMNLIGE